MHRQIPIENIYYLLCYAWDKLPEKERVSISAEKSTELVDLFARILIRSTYILLKRGVNHHYQTEAQEIQGVKGKLLLDHTLKRSLFLKQYTECEYDRFTPDTLINQILYSTFIKLIRTKNLAAIHRKELNRLLKVFPTVSQIEVTSSVFRKIKLNPTNHFYRFLLNVSELLHECLLPTEQQGEYLFVNFTEDEAKMAFLFESFVRNFYRIEQDCFKVRREDIQWSFSYTDKSHSMFLPKMQTDITLETLDKKIVIDAKYYRETMAERFGKEKIKSPNLYQLFSYLLNQEDGTARTQTATGILLYPTIDEEYDLEYCYRDHPILIRTVNLNMPWKRIAERLKEIIQVGS